VESKTRKLFNKSAAVANKSAATLFAEIFALAAKPIQQE
jgi:hypothetical protein